LEFNEKLGKGGAIIEGFKVARGEILAFADADGSTPPEEVLKVVEHAKKHGAAIGSRWLRGSKILVKQPLPRRIASRTFNFLVRLILGLKFKDTQCGCKAFRREIVEDIVDVIKIKKYAFDIELLYLLKKKGTNITEVPIMWMDKKGSKLKLRDVLNMFVSLFKIRLTV